jgi:L-amino acid N-acyltransferase YncA
VKLEFHDSITNENIFALVDSVAMQYAADYPDSDVYKPTSGNRIVLALDDDGRLLGFAAWQEWEGKAFIGLAWTAPDVRRQGVYSAIVTGLRAHAAAQGLKGLASCVHASNTASIAAHDKLLRRRLVLFQLDFASAEVRQS